MADGADEAATRKKAEQPSDKHRARTQLFAPAAICIAMQAYAVQGSFAGAVVEARTLLPRCCEPSQLPSLVLVVAQLNA